MCGLARASIDIVHATSYKQAGKREIGSNKPALGQPDLKWQMSIVQTTDDRSIWPRHATYVRRVTSIVLSRRIVYMRARYLSYWLLMLPMMML